MKHVVIIGAGITGLYAAKLLVANGYRVTVLEKTNQIGGLAYSFDYKGCVLDYGPHKLFSLIPGIMDEFKDILGDECLTIQKRNAIYLFGNYFDFPVKIMQLMLGMGPIKGAQSLTSYSWGKVQGFQKKSAITYEDFLSTRFGSYIYGVLFRDFARKVWGDPKELTEELARRRIPVSSLWQIMKSIIIKNKDSSADYFYYPKKGMHQLCDLIAQDITTRGGKILLNTVPTELCIQKNKVSKVTFKTKNIEPTSLRTNYVISTIPISLLAPLLEPKLPEQVMESAKKLQYRSAVLCYLVLNKPHVLKYNWIFFPTKDVIFNRLSESKSFSPHVCPADKTVLIAEITCDLQDPVFKQTDTELFNRVISDLEKVGLVNRSDVDTFFTKRLQKIYPVYTLDYKQHLEHVLEHIETVDNLFTLGRFGLFNYNNTDHCIHMAQCLAEHIKSHETKKEWKERLLEFDQYRIVD